MRGSRRSAPKQAAEWEGQQVAWAAHLLLHGGHCVKAWQGRLHASPSLLGGGAGGLRKPSRRKVQLLRCEGQLGVRRVHEELVHARLRHGRLTRGWWEEGKRLRSEQESTEAVTNTNQAE